MKRIVTILALALFVTAGFDAAAQMDKKERKEWKKRIKALEPEQYKNLIEENKSLKSQVSSLKNELSGVDDKLSDKDDQIAQYQRQVAGLRDELADVNSRPVEPAQVDRGGIDESKGVVFKVQIGAYENKDLNKFATNAKNFSQDEEGGVKKFTIGAFRDYWEADSFKKYLREMGVKDAFIVSYRDGQRVPIKDVLEGVTKS